MKKQKGKWGHRWIALIGGSLFLNFLPILYPYASTTNQCCAAERIMYMDQEMQGDAMLRMINEERGRLGLIQLVKDESLTKAAMIRAGEQQSLFSHTRPDGTPFYTVFSQIGIRGTIKGENLAKGKCGQYKQVVQAWFESKGHRENLLRDRFTKVGTGYVEEDGIGYWCLLFAN